MKVTCNKSIPFPKYKWGISAGEVRELPEDNEAQKRIFAEPGIREVRAPKKGKEVIRMTLIYG